MRAARNLFALLGATITTQPALAPDVSVIHHERHHDYGDRTQALIEEWRAMRVNANIAAEFYAISEKPFAKRPRVRDPRQAQFHEQTFLHGAAFFRRSGGDIAVGAANAAGLSIFDADAKLWLKVLRQQQRGRWNRERKLMFEQAVEALRIITNEGGHIQNACDWQPLEIEGYEVLSRSSDEIVVEVRIFNPNEIDSPVAALCLMLLTFGAPLIEWAKRKSYPARKRTKTKFRLRFVNGELDVRFARSSEVQG